MRNEIIAIIKEVASKQKVNINLSGATLDKPFKEMGIDSINVLGIIVAIEDKIGCRLEEKTLLKIKTINQLVDAFEALKK